MASSFQTPSTLDTQNSGVLAHASSARPLRRWPALILLPLLLLTWLGWYALDEVQPFMFMIIGFGPLVLSALIAAWWLFASRARGRDRILGLLALVAAGSASFALAHYTVRGMFFFFNVLPFGVVAFVSVLLLLARMGSGVATWTAVAVSTICFGLGDVVRNDGFSGSFRAAISWRWQPSSEDQYLASLDSKQVPATVEVKKTDIGTVRWPQFRGPKRDGVVPGIRLNEDWTVAPPKEIWRRKVGPAWSSFAATDELLYTQEQRGDQEAVVCWDARTGAEVWSYAYPSRFWEAVAGVGPRATPTLHDGALFVLGAQGILCRLDARTGTVAWTRDLRKDAEREPPVWGFSSSPLVVKDAVLVHAGGADNKGLLAYDVKTGDPRWGAPAGDHSYSSPELATVAGQESVLMLTNTGLRAHDPATGQVRWEHEWKFQMYRVVQPLVFGDSSVLLGTMIGAGTRRIDVAGDNAGYKVTERWTSQGMKPGFNDYVVHHGHLFGFDNTIFACIDLQTGQQKWKGGRYGNGQVLLLPDGGQLLVISEKGELVLLHANPEQHEEKARFHALTGKTWNHPVLVGNRLYVRNGEEAACFELSVASRP
jgi:outer membrane protein assembly factor BamB